MSRKKKKKEEEEERAYRRCRVKREIERMHRLTASLSDSLHRYIYANRQMSISCLSDFNRPFYLSSEREREDTCSQSRICSGSACSREEEEEGRAGRTRRGERQVSSSVKRLQSLSITLFSISWSVSLHADKSRLC